MQPINEQFSSTTNNCDSVGTDSGTFPPLDLGYPPEPPFNDPIAEEDDESMRLPTQSDNDNDEKTMEQSVNPIPTRVRVKTFDSQLSSSSSSKGAQRHSFLNIARFWSGSRQA